MTDNGEIVPAAVRFYTIQQRCTKSQIEMHLLHALTITNQINKTIKADQN